MSIIAQRHLSMVCLLMLSLAFKTLPKQERCAGPCLVPGAHHEQALGVVHALQIALQRLRQLIQLQVLDGRPRQPLIHHLRWHPGRRATISWKVLVQLMLCCPSTAAWQ